MTKLVKVRDTSELRSKAKTSCILFWNAGIIINKNQRVKCVLKGRKNNIWTKGVFRL